MNIRPDWDTYFIQMCDLVATRSTCDRKHVGSVIVKDRRVISTGFNGSIPGQSHCDDPEEYWQCTKCGEKFAEFPQECHRLECAGYPVEKKYGGHDLESGHCIRTTHSEINAIAQAARMGVSTDKATIYINTRPCYTCFKAIVSAGIQEVVYSDEYPAEHTDRVAKVAKELPNFVLRKYEGDQ